MLLQRRAGKWGRRTEEELVGFLKTECPNKAASIMQTHAFIPLIVTGLNPQGCCEPAGAKIS